MHIPSSLSHPHLLAWCRHHHLWYVHVLCRVLVGCLLFWLSLLFLRETVYEMYHKGKICSKVGTGGVLYLVSASPPNPSLSGFCWLLSGDMLDLSFIVAMSLVMTIVGFLKG